MIFLKIIVFKAPPLVVTPAVKPLIVDVTTPPLNHATPLGDISDKFPPLCTYILPGKAACVSVTAVPMLQPPIDP